MLRTKERDSRKSIQEVQSARRTNGLLGSTKRGFFALPAVILKIIPSMRTDFIKNLGRRHCHPAQGPVQTESPSMPLPIIYESTAPARAELDASRGLKLLQFGVDWCGHCQAAESAVCEALQAFPGLEHQRIEDAAGRPLGRSFRVKLWPTLILLRDGQELARLVRPTQAEQILALLHPFCGAK